MAQEDHNPNCADTCQGSYGRVKDKTAYSQLADGRRSGVSLSVRYSDVPRVDMDPDEVYGGKIGERDGGDEKQHGGREEEDNTRDAESSGRHVGLGGRGRHESDFIFCDFIPKPVEPP